RWLRFRRLVREPSRSGRRAAGDAWGPVVPRLRSHGCRGIPSGRVQRWRRAALVSGARGAATRGWRACLYVHGIRARSDDPAAPPDVVLTELDAAAVVLLSAAGAARWADPDRRRSPGAAATARGDSGTVRAPRRDVRPELR